MDAPAGALDPETVQALRDHKGEILAALAAADRGRDLSGWDGETAELVRWYEAAAPMLPAAPFRLDECTRLADPLTFYRSLSSAIDSGPRGPVLDASLRGHLERLKAAVGSGDA